MATTATTAVPHCPNPGRVLVVEDDVNVRRFSIHVLTRAGHAVIGAGSVEAALEFLARGEYDVALLDLQLPGRSGLDLIGELPAGTVPVLITGDQSVGTAVAAMKGGAFDYLPKPVDPELLRYAVGRAVKEAQSRRRARAAEQAMAVWEATFDACPDALLVLDAGRHVLKANLAAAQVTGARPDALHGRHVRQAYPGELGEVAAGDPDGRSRPARVAGRQYLVTSSPLHGPPGEPAAVVVVARDVTAMVRGAQARTRLAQRVLSAQEDERGRVSRELHDGVGQAAVSLSLGLAGLVELVPPGPARERLRELGRTAADAADEIRRMAHHLRPPVLDDHGLAAALARLTDSFSRAHGVRAELVLTTPAVGRLHPAVELALYRIVQEGLANVAKHAAARTVDVELEVADGAAHVSVIDDGAGFIPADDPCDGVGLSGMRERAVMLGGSFRVASVLGRGTTVEARIPLAEDAP